MSPPIKELKRGQFLELRKPLKDPKKDLLKIPKPMDAKNCGPLSAGPDEAKPKTLNKIWSRMLMQREKGGGIFTLIHSTPDQFLLQRVETSPSSERTKQKEKKNWRERGYGDSIGSPRSLRHSPRWGWALPWIWPLLILLDVESAHNLQNLQNATDTHG